MIRKDQDIVFIEKVKDYYRLYLDKIYIDVFEKGENPLGHSWNCFQEGGNGGS
jgi:hypothetical protein